MLEHSAASNNANVPAPSDATMKPSQGRSSRRSLLKTATWVAPSAVVAVAAPAVAASPTCTTQEVQLNWGIATVQAQTPPAADPGVVAITQNRVTFNPQPAITQFPQLNSPLTVTIVHRFYGAARATTANSSVGTLGNGQVSPQNVGGIGQVGYTLLQMVGASGAGTPTNTDYQTIQFTFSEAITDLEFSLTDIDRTWTSATSGTRDFIDGLSLTSPSPYRAVAPQGSSVIGSGVAPSGGSATAPPTQPWQNSANANQPEDGPGGQIDIAFTAPVTTFTVRYDNLMRTEPRPTGQNNDQAAFVTGFRAKRPTVC